MPVRYKDYYQVLGVARTATQDEIKRAYRRQAKVLHPDHANGGSGNEQKFIELVEAHEVLGDPERRAQYDRLGSNWRQDEDFVPPEGWKTRANGRVRVVRTQGRPAQGDFSEFFDVFSNLRGPGKAGRRNGGVDAAGGAAAGAHSDLETELSISLQEAFKGTEKTITLAIQRKSKLRGTRIERKTFKVKIPPGVRQGQLLRLKGQGGRTNGKDDDILIRLVFAPDPRFDVEGEDLVTELPVTPWEAALGATVRVSTIDGVARLKLPSPCSSGQRVRMRGQGLRKNNGERGDLICRVVIELPEELSTEERRLFQDLADVSEFRPRGED